MASNINGTLSNTPSYSKDIDTCDLSSRVLFSFGMGLCIAVLSCTVFMFCSRRFDLFITSRLTRNRVCVVQYMDERCSSHISELETWTDTDCGVREDTDTIVPGDDHVWVQAMMNELVMVKALKFPQINS